MTPATLCSIDVEVTFRPGGEVRRVQGVAAGSTVVIDAGGLFSDGFESVNASAWSAIRGD